MSDPWSGSGPGALASPFAPTGEERRTGCASRSEPAELDELDELDARGEWGEWSESDESDEWSESDEWGESDGNVEAYAGADTPEAGEELLEDESAIYAASLAAAEDSAPAYGEDWFVPIGIPTPTVPAPGGPAGGAARGPGQVTAAGAAIPIKVPPPCVAVPALTTAERACAGVDSTGFAGNAAVATFAGRIADCYANRMAQRRQRERHAKAQDQAVRQARAAKVPGDTAARAQRIAAARAAVRPEPIETVRTDIRAKYLKFLEDEYRDTIIGAGNRPKARKRPQSCQFNTVSRQWMYGVREQLDFITLGTGGRGLAGFAPPPRPAGGDQLVDIEPPATTDGGAKVQPIMNAFLRELRARAPAHRAYNYPDHGGGAFNARGYSIDIELRGAKDERGFYPRPAAVQFLLAIDAAARAAGVEWRAIYNDYGVAATINQHLDRMRVIFVGKPRRGGRRIGLNWHGPLILHFHVDITPRSA